MSLQGAWSFNEGSGSTSTDVSGNNRPAINVPGWTTNGHTAGGMQVSGTGTGARVAIPGSFWFHGTSTLMCWVRLATIGGTNQKVFSIPRAYGSENGHNVIVNSSGQLLYRDQTTTKISGPTLVENQWYHVALAFDWMEGGGGNNSRLYVDGSLVGSSDAWPIADEGALWWGSGNDLPMNGTIDDARWYDHQLSQAEIQTMMNTPVAGLLESSGTTRFVKDQGGSWQPLRTQRIVGSPSGGTSYGWQLTAVSVGLNKHGINGENLPNYTGPIKPAAGAVIVGKKINSGLDLSNGNITLERCYIKPTTISVGSPVVTTFNYNTVQPGAGPSTIRDCTFDGTALTEQQSAMSFAIQAMGITTGNYIHGFGSGIMISGVGTQFDCLVEGNYVTGLTAWGDPGNDGNHSDGFTVRDFSTAAVPTRQLVVRNNRFDCSSAHATGALFIQTSSGNIGHALIEGNLLEGGGYNLSVNAVSGNSYSNLHATNNRFNVAGFGAALRQGGSGFTTWTSNYINNPGQPDNIGTTVAAP